MLNKYSQIKDYSKIPELCPIPNLLDIQKKSFEEFLQRFTPPDKRKKQGLEEVFLNIFPIQDFTGNLILDFISYSLGECKDSDYGCLEKGGTYSAPLEVKINLISKKTGEIKEQDVFMGDLPLMTENGSFIINGAERVIVNQLIRSPGIYFDEEKNESSNILFKFKIIPNRGSWLEFGFDSSNMIYVRIDKRRKIPATTLLRALGYETNGEIMELFDEEEIIKATLEKDNTTNEREALIEIFRRLRPSEPPTERNTRQLIHRLLFDPKRYDLAKVGRYKINRKLSFGDRILNKTVAHDIFDPDSKKIIIKAEERINQKAFSIIIKAGIEKVKVLNSENETVTIFNEKDESLMPIIDKLSDGINEKIIDTTIVEDIINQASGEIICKAGSELNSALLNKIKEYKEKIKVKKGYSLTKEDIVASLRYLVNLYRGIGYIDDIDHLGNRRVKTVGELLQDQFYIGLTRMERVIRERMTIQPDVSAITPQALINARPLLATIRQFFGSSQLSQFMDQTNPLSEITHKRRLSALGPGGLTRERAGFEVRDVHHTHYGRICPIETPEGPNVGLIGSLCIYAKVNELGFIETPYFRVIDGKVTNEIAYLSADEEDKYKIAQINIKINEDSKISQDNVPCRFRGEIIECSPQDIDFIDVSPKQIASISASLIPFLEHDDANRALMGTNMQRQSVPIIRTEIPLVGTGMENKVAIDSGAVVVSKDDGMVEKVSADKIIIKCSNNTIKEYSLKKFVRSNQGTCINQIPIVEKGVVVKKGDIIADGPLTSQGCLSLGRNILIAYMPWEGYNFEDAILISDKLVREDIFTSIHISEHECAARDTKLGPEEITCDIPNIGEGNLSNLDESGIVRIGAEVESGDILVGKVTPKGETDLGPEERLLRAIFGEKAREVRDTSLRVPHGEKGKVIDVKVFSRENNDELSPPGVNKLVKVFIAQKRKISEGDKISGRHGNKGVISKILPENDMPFMADGTPIEIVLNPLGVPSRMNVGQILEVHLGWAAKTLGFRIITPIFNGAKEEEIKQALIEAKLPKDGKTILFDGRTGRPFDQKVTVGYSYILKLNHLVDDKIHARSTGPYSLVTQQPLGGKAQFGGQRFGEMEVWALEGYGAAYNLQEMLTVKSDDVTGRIKTYEAIVKGENIPVPGMPESFKVLIKELRSLNLDVKVLDSQNKEVEIKEDIDSKDEINENLMKEIN
ncbi:MAG: DNA-directed RNA polymerase subunit beta [bacterium]|uniref:DNA-directed RNA polymerase subunit beta n=1 Tax=Candidatus Infernicultor aquiphilus TaxID=1805029 RepID=A0A1J5GCP3_9BACT|nr:DNA-directed RNA polymerase subunit beta [bacterium]OIP67386.1 MAG: DNA-directed RNA polymerase subunit beta [Candidatus Atribacteria bacterium CG2_30_33_13]PIU24779.1 MAG: DNA-directed RNA polymerase subunit beta [Candidatus Atribacteria bacterium CG08_land_8_20_14_0_20_33_29]PIW11812.1 MAG: DNA-directed RNA polymerase subunit beta [Candidatus Atribacteria bacterium CG17_big_fil_post_rev_8_21_14_2_50_34_11]PIX33529.1 MAG: DNA-directed RNA polymerase subunit beta [Candidatus Atribacteria bac